VNPEYDGKRASDRLAAPEALHLPAGAFARLRARRLAEGAADGQVKDPAFLDPAALTRLVEGAP
jgi:hypothetical protein